MESTKNLKGSGQSAITLWVIKQQLCKKYK